MMEHSSAKHQVKEEEEEEDEKKNDCTQAHGGAGSHNSGGNCTLGSINHQISFGEAEEDLLIRMHAVLGNRWSLITGRLPGRTENEVKDYWNSCLKQKLIDRGIDPENHRMPAHSQLGCCMGCVASSSTLSLNPTDTKNDKGYDDASSSNNVEDDAQSLPDLNLDLTATSCSMATCIEEVRENVFSKAM